MTDHLRQTAEKLKSASNVLVVLPPLASLDAVAAGLALVSYLRKTDKTAVVVSADGEPTGRASFLPGFGQIMRELSRAKGFIIDVSTKRTGVDELTYKKDGDRLSIYLKPKSGEFTAEDVIFRKSKFPYEAVIVIGLDKLEALGPFYGLHAELFFEVPVINLDYRGSNSGFGQFNAIELSASSQSEVVLDLLLEMGPDFVDADMATTLLAGMTAETNSFQSARTTPQVFQKAAQLASLGARQQDVVTQLYKNKGLGFLKLWGRVLARLRIDSETQVAHSAATRQDMEKSGADLTDANAILREMGTQLSFTTVRVFFRELEPNLTEVNIAAPSSLRLASVFAEFQPTSLNAQALRFQVPQPLPDAEERIMPVIRTEAQKLV